MSSELDRALLPAGCRVLCAVSGGADSMCLLFLLAREGYDVTAAHFEHGLRGEESRRDAAFVAAWCREKGIPFVLGRGDAAAYAAERKLGIEEAARELRYAFLERTADELGCERIATAHNAGDNAETLLLNLTRGSGAAGLRGIPRQRGRIVRPLLDRTREEILACLEENGVPHVEDSSNASDAFSRNRIRHQVIPALEAINPAFLRAAARTAALLGEDEDCLGSLAEAFIRRCYDGESLPQAELAALHPAVAARVIRRLCPKALSRAQVEAVLALREGGERRELDLPGLRLRREQGRLFFTAEETLPTLPERLLPEEGVLDVPELGLRLRTERAVYRGEIHDLFKHFFIKYESIEGSVRVTGRRAGDRLRPAGRGCTKSLKALFLEAGMTRGERDGCLVFRDGRGILAVSGLAADERGLPKPGDPILRVEIVSCRA